MDIVTRKEAKERGLKTYYTGKPCKHGHLSERYTKNGTCVECQAAVNKEYGAEWRKANPEYSRQYYEANKERLAEYNRQWRKEHSRGYDPQYYEANKERLAEYYRQWREANREKRAEHQRRYIAKNRDKLTANQAKRRAAKLDRTPAWADLDMIDVFYALAKEMTEETGTVHHVDHIIPLQGENVSGLHVATNLQVIPAADNHSKGNSYTP